MQITVLVCGEYKPAAKMLRHSHDPYERQMLQDEPATDK